ncbi:MAG: hypothetical protein AB7V32_00605 [Candidatus Berkiella sp.]
MSLDLNLARTGISIQVKDKSELSKELFEALFKNKNLLRFDYDFSPKEHEQPLLKLLNEHIDKNIQNALKDTQIRVLYGNEDKLKGNKNLRFNDPAFCEAKTFIFKQFNMKQGVKDAQQKLEALKFHLCHELAFKCKNRTFCAFEVDTFAPGTPFLSEGLVSFLKLKKDCQVIQLNPRSKYQSNLPKFTLLGAGAVMGLASLISLPFVTLSTTLLMCVLTNVLVYVGGKIDDWRQRFLFKAGHKALIALQDGTKIDDQSIKDSLVAGEAAKEWKGYFKSYLNFKTYTPKNYGAFSAGLYSGVNDLKVQKEAIHKLKA